MAEVQLRQAQHDFTRLSMITVGLVLKGAAAEEFPQDTGGGSQLVVQGDDK